MNWKISKSKEQLFVHDNSHCNLFIIYSDTTHTHIFVVPLRIYIFVIPTLLLLLSLLSTRGVFQKSPYKFYFTISKLEVDEGPDIRNIEERINTKKDSLYL